MSRQPKLLFLRHHRLKDLKYSFFSNKRLSKNLKYFYYVLECRDLFEIPPLSPGQVVFPSLGCPAHSMFLVKFGMGRRELSKLAFAQISFDTPNSFVAVKTYFPFFTLPSPHPLVVKILPRRYPLVIFGVGRQMGEILSLNVTLLVNHKIAKSLSPRSGFCCSTYHSQIFVIDGCAEMLQTGTMVPSVSKWPAVQ